MTPFPGHGAARRRTDRGLGAGAAWLVVLALALVPRVAFAWPSDNQWLALVKGGGPIQDNERDANGGVNVVPDDGTHAAAFIANDGAYLFYRIRLDGRPDGGGNGVLAQFGWGFELDTDQDADDYEWLIMCDGISSPEVVALEQNTVQLDLGQPSDKAEIVTATWPLVGNHRIVMADTSINGDQDYFLDFRIPLAVLKSATGITDDTLIRYFVGSSRSTNNLTENGADLVAGSSLYQGLSDYITVSGTLPPSMSFNNGSVAFVADLGGFGDRTLAAPGDRLYLRVEDGDLNATTLPGGRVRVELTTPGGDVEVVELTATGVAGKYTGSLLTATGAASTRDGVLQVASGQTVTVTYLDAVAADRSQNVARTDTILITATGTDIALTKTVNNASPDEGRRVTFTVTAFNNGPNTATGLQVTDLLPAGLVYFSHTVTGSATYTSGTGVWNIGTLARDASATLTVTATVAAGTNGQTLVNTASVTALVQTDAYAPNDSASAAIRVGGTDLRVTKSVNNGFPDVGGDVVFTVEVRNLGPSATTGVLVSDVLPAGLTLLSATPTRGTYAGGVWTVGALGLNAAERLTLAARVNPGTAGQTIVNTAALSGTDQPDINAANDSASATVRVGFLDLALTKTVDNPGPNINTNITWTVRLTNNGPAAGTGIVVTDLLPAGVTYQSHAATQGTWTGASGAWSVGALAAGATATLSVVARVDSGSAGLTIVNEARITARDQPDSNGANDVAAATIGVGGTDIRVLKSVDNATPNPGGTVTWLVTVTNNGPNAASGVGVTDLLPAGVTGIKAGNGIQYTATQGTFTSTTGVWSVGTLAVAASATLSIPTTVDAGTAGRNITNAAMLTALNQVDIDDTNNVGSAVISVAGTDLAITKTVDNATPNIGQNIVYTLTARNNGPNGATGVTVTDLLPPELVYVSHSPAAAAYDPASGIWNIGTLANAATTTLAITANVRNEDHRLIITNTARIESPSQGDPVPGNDVSSVPVTVAATDLRVTKTTSNASPFVGATFTFTVEVANLGANLATGVEVEDLLPAGLALVGAAPAQGTYGSGLWLVGDVAGGASVSLVMTVRAGPGTAGTSIVNTARLLAVDQIDTLSTNNTAAVSVVPQAVPPAVLTLVKSADAATATPGQTLVYSIIVGNTGTGPALNLVVDDRMSPYTALSLDAFGAGVAFQFVDGTPASGVTPGTPEYSNDGGATFTYVPVSGGGGAPPGCDGAVTHWRIPLGGTFGAGRQFTLVYKSMVK